MNRSLKLALGNGGMIFFLCLAAGLAFATAPQLAREIVPVALGMAITVALPVTFRLGMFSLGLSYWLGLYILFFFGFPAYMGFEDDPSSGALYFFGSLTILVACVTVTLTEKYRYVPSSEEKEPLWRLLPATVPLFGFGLGLTVQLIPLKLADERSTE